MFNKRFSVLLLGACFGPLSWGQSSPGKITGTVKGKDGSVIPGATVIVSPSWKETKASSEGQFQFTNLQPGNYVIFVQSDGFQPWVNANQAVRPGETVTATPTLHLAQADELQHGSLTANQIEWYARHLSAMKESMFCEKPLSKVEEYRFLALPTFGNPILVKVQLTRGRATATVKILSGEGGYEPGSLKEVRSHALDDPITKHLLWLLEDADFWRMPTRIEFPNLIVVDGTQWVAEGTKSGNCHIVDRTAPDTGAFNLIAMAFARLGKLKTLPK